jgi:hypothetical protein
VLRAHKRADGCTHTRQEKRTEQRRGQERRESGQSLLHTGKHQATRGPGRLAVQELTDKLEASRTLVGVGSCPIRRAATVEASMALGRCLCCSDAGRSTAAAAWDRCETGAVADLCQRKTDATRPSQCLVVRLSKGVGQRRGGLLAEIAHDGAWRVLWAARVHEDSRRVGSAAATAGELPAGDVLIVLDAHFSCGMVPYHDLIPYPIARVTHVQLRARPPACKSAT